MKSGQYLRKTAAASLALSFVLPMASCDSKPKTEGSHSGKLIEENMPWFETKTYQIDTGVVVISYKKLNDKLQESLSFLYKECKV